MHIIINIMIQVLFSPLILLFFNILKQKLLIQRKKNLRDNCFLCLHLIHHYNNNYENLNYHLIHKIMNRHNLILLILHYYFH